MSNPAIQTAVTFMAQNNLLARCEKINKKNSNPLIIVSIWKIKKHI
ncbi:hypothetical protein DCCM_0709 [Desulfocucumis palustris]|uniref:Uncharacterized protein n=1 Tax=Desulfocucumis palustris TaxID=1898651 RepID=A0A2L2XA56_9FIRM|nr:hypothetical protein DCCM_0709 [Desulfocucumis palustris]